MIIYENEKFAIKQNNEGYIFEPKGRVYVPGKDKSQDVYANSYKELAEKLNKKEVVIRHSFDELEVCPSYVFLREHLREQADKIARTANYVDSCRQALAWLDGNFSDASAYSLAPELIREEEY